MEIKEYNLKFDPIADRMHTSNIIIHHSASDDASAPDIHKWHRDIGYSGIGYHFVIRKYGTIERGRPLNKVGAHAGSEYNYNSIGICLAGNFVVLEPQPEQIRSLLMLIDHLEEHYGKKLKVLRHSDVYSTACPGSKFPWPLPGVDEEEDWKQAIIDRAFEERLITEDHDPDETADKWFVLAVSLNLIDRIMEL